MNNMELERARATCEYCLDGKAFPDPTNLKKEEMNKIHRFFSDIYDQSIELFRNGLPEDKKIYATSVRVAAAETWDSLYNDHKGILIMVVGIMTFALGFFLSIASLIVIAIGLSLFALGLVLEIKEFAGRPSLLTPSPREQPCAIDY